MCTLCKFTFKSSPLSMRSVPLVSITKKKNVYRNFGSSTINSKNGDSKKALLVIIPKGTLFSGLDTKNQLMTTGHREDSKQKIKGKEKGISIKREKVLLLKSQISEHDTQTQLKKAMNWINKMYQVRVVISGSNNKVAGSTEQVFSVFEQFFKKNEDKALIIQKQKKGQDIKFQIIPIKKNENGGDSNYL